MVGDQLGFRDQVNLRWFNIDQLGTAIFWRRMGVVKCQQLD
jgi:hypothetical protein